MEPEKETTTTQDTAETVTPETVEQPKEKTAAEIAQEAAPAPKKPETVGIDKFLDEKKGRKEAEKALKDLQEKMAVGDTPKAELTGDLADIAAAFPDVNPQFLEMIGKAIDKKNQEKLKPFEEKEKQEKIDAAFNKAMKETLEAMPEFADAVNPDVIKSLAKDPQNANKTFTQLVEETYGYAVTGKRTLETTKPGGGKEPAPLDYNKALKDSEYFGEVMANPKLKAEYNAEMLKRTG